MRAKKNKDVVKLYAHTSAEACRCFADFYSRWNM